MLYVLKASLYSSGSTVPEEKKIYPGNKSDSEICPALSTQKNGADLLRYLPEKFLRSPVPEDFKKFYIADEIIPS